MSMSSKEEKLIIAKTKLMTALGENGPNYLSNLKNWFRQKWTQEEFDIESRKLLTPDQLDLHNEFFLAILNKVGIYTPPNQLSIDSNNSSQASKNSRKRKRSSRPIFDRMPSEPEEMYDYLPNECNEIGRPLYAAQELFLPDTGLVMGRLLVSAWEIGLTSSEDNVAEYVVLAVQVLLKNIISAILQKKKPYRTTSNGAFFYDVGCPTRNPFIRNTLSRRHIDDSPIELDKAITSMNINRPISNEDSVFLAACENFEQKPRRRITVKDVFNVMLDKNIIPSHTVHSINLERIAQAYQ